MKLFHKGKTLASTLLNIIGLTFAFAALYIIIVQVHYDFSHNKGIKDSERVYELLHKDFYDESKLASYINRPIPEKIIQELPIVEKGGPIKLSPFQEDLYLTENSDPIHVKNYLSTVGGLETIGVELIEGRWEDWIPGWSTILLTESLASKLGVHAGDMVKFLSIGSTQFEEAKVAAVFKDMPENSDFPLTWVYNIGSENMDSLSEWSYDYYVKFKPGLTEEEINAALGDYLLNGNLGEYLTSGWGVKKEELELDRGFIFFPIQDTYLNPLVISQNQKGNKTTTLTLLGVAILITIIAFINYFNFFFALMPVKLKEINTRKILGGSRSRLIMSMVLESLCYVFMALGLGAVLVVIFSHSPYSDLISTSVVFKYHWGMTFITIGTAVVIGMLSSLFPAYYITTFNPAMALRGSFTSYGRGNMFRNGLIGFQFTVSIILLICAIVINHQRNFMLHHDLGFERDNLLTVSVTGAISAKSEMVGDRLKEDPAISDVTWADGPVVANERMGWGRGYNGENITLIVYPVATNFLQFMNIPIIEGRDFVRSDVESENGLFILNEAAKNKFDLKIGDRFNGHRDEPAEIIGFAKDINYLPLREDGGAFCFYQFGKFPWRNLQQLYVRATPNVNLFEVKERIAKILSEIDPTLSETQWDVQFFDDTLEEFYVKEKNLSKLINLFTLLSIVISLMGVFGLVMFDTERRKKEIGIRRVNGATVKEILGMFNLKFIIIVIVSFIIAIPLSYWIISVYLESYAYRTPIYIWVFFVAFLAVLFITTGVVTLRSYSAAIENPVDALKTE
ncbi:MAG: ABC transporter permease [Muribaculaceae bacterium]|nr:ABC transporter permease [Muribaculaceae bacterium]